MDRSEIPLMATIVELRQIIGPERIGKVTAYRIARQHGVRLGKRYLIPRDVILALLENRLKLRDDK